ncbi:MAG: hypothetical protein HC851_18720 [Acaryochloris sp. RU_4_1]|nr:hypothetical protein [Acaryochloris sp. RU_4_1]
MIRYSGNEEYKEQMMQAFQTKWEAKLEKSRAACVICNLKEQDLITENGRQSDTAEFGQSEDQEMGAKGDLDTGIWSERAIKLGRNAHPFAFSPSP